MGHKISKEQIDPGVKDHIMSFVGDVADLETEVNTDIISAVNSLMVDRVDNAENMGKIANVIGEPVTANHSVDEVVQGLGEMLSTFKTNMMNSGVMVESSDKFKQLIDKIKGLTEGEGNKGIQYVEGTVVRDSTHAKSFNEINGNGSSGSAYLILPKLNFKPTILIALSKNLFSEYYYYPVISLIVHDYNYNKLSAKTANFSGGGYDGPTYNFIADELVFLEDAIHLPVHNGGSAEFNWFAIGVGEEDTTLRDSLASILGDKGVDVTEDDDMASLITKVDEEFTKDNNEMIELTNKVNTLENKTELTSWIGDIWGSKPLNDPFIFSYGSCDIIDDKVYMFTGYDFYKINLNGVDYELIRSSTTERRGSAMEVIDGKIFLIGGESNTNELFDPITNSWTTKEPSPVKIGYAPSVVYNNQIYLIGGYNTNLINAIYMYDPALNTWTKKNTKYAYQGAGATVINGNIYITSGGEDSGNFGPENCLTCYNPTTDTSTTKTALSYSNYVMDNINHCTESYGNTLYMFGGMTGGTDSQLQRVASYNVTTDKWTIENDMPSRGAGMCSCKNDNVFYLFGGSYATYSSGWRYYDTPPMYYIADKK